MPTMIVKAVVVTLLLAWSTEAHSRALRQEKKFYIFGYGSLLLDVSRIKTNCALSGITESAIGALRTLFTRSNDTQNAVFLAGCDNTGIRPVRVQGIRRGWYAPGTFSGGLGKALADPKFSKSAFGIVPTYLGAVKSTKASETATGLVYEATEQQFNLTVERETAAGYLVVDIPLSSIAFLDGQPAIGSNARVVFFANTENSVELPSRRKPICQSYVDIWLAGAVKVTQQWNLTGPAYQAASPTKSADFVAETIRTTFGWRPFWINDRFPVYRPFVNMPQSVAIDQALYANVDKSILRSIKFPFNP